MPRALCWSYGGGVFLCARCPCIQDFTHENATRKQCTATSGTEHPRTQTPTGPNTRVLGAHVLEPLVPRAEVSLVSRGGGLRTKRIRSHPGGNAGANLKSISHRCHPILVAFVWELTTETIYLPLGCLQGGDAGVGVHYFVRSGVSCLEVYCGWLMDRGCTQRDRGCTQRDRGCTQREVALGHARSQIRSRG